MNPEHPRSQPARRVHALQRGQSLAEYLVITALVVLALVAGPDSALQQLFEAVGERYERFTQEVSRP